MVDLDSLIIKCEQFSCNKELETFARKKYAELYLANGHFGIHKAHDGVDIIFWESRFEHAFFESRNRYCSYDKCRISVSRVERMAWIREVVQKKAPEIDCYLIPSQVPLHNRLNRLYVLWPKDYVVWLEPRSRGGWKFSTAYNIPKPEIRKRYVKMSRRCIE